MREWRRCPKCGYTKIGACPGCFPEQAKREWDQELEETLAAEADEQRRRDGQLWCHEHRVHDLCVRKATIDEIRAELRSEPAPDWRTATTWQERMAVLRRRYVSPW